MIVQDVQQSIAAVNNIVASLERDAPLSSDIIQMSYPQETVDEFLGYSQAVVDVSVFSMVHTIPRIQMNVSCRVCNRQRPEPRHGSETQETVSPRT